ncbi:MAG: CocE/NonD family hydrolase, partial [Actinomycetota bacterium]
MPRSCRFPSSTLRARKRCGARDALHGPPRVSEELTWIPLSDGVRLAATLYLPEREPPWPAIIEALPYRKDDV